jgi:long-chain acyl-CoA synthetase
MNIDLPLERAYHWESVRPQEILLSQPINGVVRDFSWAETMNQARRIANHLLAKNWPAGSHIVIYSKNCCWWIMAELAIWMSGHVTVPIYASLTGHAARQLFEHCEPVACFVGPLDTPEPLEATIPENIHLIRFPNALTFNAHSWDSLVADTEPLASNTKRHADDIATIIYTSGTTGSPKGAMHRFLAFPYLAQTVAQVSGEGRQRALSYLPLAHIAERGLTETTALYYSWHLYFSESPSTFLADLKRAKPTVFFSVPRLYAKFQQKIFEKLSREKLERLQGIPLVKTLLGKYIIHGLGLGHTLFAASGSAALPIELLVWFRSLGLPLTEGYGTTETGITHTAPKGESRPGYTGKSGPSVETKISAGGEILIRSPMNMLGYYKNPEETRQIFTDDGFIHSGDLGELSADGWLKISGRIKEQFKTAKGKYVAPSAIENLLATHPAIENCLVLGAGRAAPCAVAALTVEALQQASTETGRKALQKTFENLLNSVNSKVEPHERLAFIALTHSHWTIQNGFVTPTLKLKRAPLETFYNELIPEWLDQRALVVWHLT